jgi:dipeptide transport system substrate-binding protein
MLGFIRFPLFLLIALTVSTGAATAKSLVFCSEGSPEGFDPALYTAGTTFDASSRPVYNRLLAFKRGSTNVIPSLAESWEISEDGLSYTFKLRQQVSFHTTEFFTPTRNLNADDVIFSFDRQLKKDHTWNQYVPGGMWTSFDALSMPELLKSVQKIDEHTVRFVLSRPDASMLSNFAMDFASIMSAEYAAKIAADGKKEMLNLRPIGTGPFKFTAYQLDSVVRFTAHDGYWDGEPAIKNLIFSITTDATTRQLKLKTGQCHVAPHPNPSDIDALRNDPSLRVMEQDGFNIGYLAYNTTQSPFDRVEVRKALNMAINKKAIVEAVFQGTGIVAKNPIPPTMWSYNDEIEDDPYDPDQAAKLLGSAGIRNLQMKIWAMPVQRAYNPNARRMAELIQADFAKVGVEAEIVSYEWAEYLKRSKEKNRDGAVLLGWTGGNGDPDSFLAVLLGCDGVSRSNRAQWCNAEFEELIQSAKIVTDKTQRARLYEQAQAIFKREAPWATIAHSVVHLPMSKKVSGYVMDPLGGHWFDNVDIEE